jgi:putative addiction module component (TIGR02574 family)
MPSKIQEIENEILLLSPEERAILAEHIIRSLDSEEDPDVERLWIAEADRRYTEYKEGKTQARPAALVLKETRAKLKKQE